MTKEEVKKMLISMMEAYQKMSLQHMEESAAWDKKDIRTLEFYYRGVGSTEKLVADELEAILQIF